MVSQLRTLLYLLLVTSVDQTLMNAELARLRKERETRRKLVSECSTLCSQLENDVNQLLADVDAAETSSTLGKQRGSFINKAKVLHEKGTLHLLKIDSIQATSQEERPKARSERKQLVARIEACSTRLQPFTPP